MRSTPIFICIIFLFLINNPLRSQQLSDQARVSLMTGTPGDQLYNCFGHSAIRIEDPTLRMDLLFNYGTFNFDTPNFYLKFVQRKLLYTLSKNSYKGLKRLYEQEGRGIYIQEILLSQEEKQALYDRLQENYKPENREYLYDFFYDNCATRIRDILQETLGEDLNLPETKDKRRFRSYLDEYLEVMPWIDLGIDIILGLEADRKANIENQMFLPDYLADNLAAASYKGKPLMGKKVWTLEKAATENLPNSNLPFLVMLLVSLFLAGASWWSRKNTKVLAIIDVSLFTLLSLAALLVAFLWFGTDHIATQYNLSLFWANPLYLIWIFVLGRSKKPAGWIQGLAWILLISNIVALSMFALAIQQYNLALLPIILLISMRLYHRMAIWHILPFPENQLPNKH